MRINFDANNVAETTVIPAGWYHAIAVATEVKEAKADADNTYLAVSFRLLNPEVSGRQVFARITLTHHNPVAQSLGQSQLAQLCRAVGKLVLEDTQELHGIPLEVKVLVEPPKNGYDEGNKVTGYRASTTDAPPFSLTPPTDTSFDSPPQTPVAAGLPATPAWAL